MRIFSKTGFAIALVGLVSAGAALPAMAGGLGTPAIEAPVVAVAPAVHNPGGDWTGGWVGANLGYGNARDGTQKGNGALYGLSGGYDYDFGSWVAGVGLSWDKADINLGAGTDKLKDIARLKFRVGADMGRTLVYATAGPARASADIGAISTHDNGWFAGVGADYAVNDQWTVGGEVLANQFNNFGGTATDLKATTAAINVGFRF